MARSGWKKYFYREFTMKNLTRRAILAAAPAAVPFLSAHAAGQYGR
jgi:hypothetical protein